MFGGNNKKSRRPIGIAVGHGEVLLAQAAPIGSGEKEAELVASARAPLPEGAAPGKPGYDEQLTKAIGQALRQAPFTGKLAVSAMPAATLQYKNVRLPKMPEPELAQAVSWEAKERVILGEPAAVQFYYAGEVRQGQDARCEVILLAAKQSRVDEHLRGVVGAGLTPLAIDGTGAAIARSVTQHDETTFTIFLDQTHAEVVIAQAGRVLLDKLLPLGPGGAEQADPSELAREIGLCLRYHSVTFRGDRPAQAQLRGEPMPPAFSEAIATALGLELVDTGEAGRFAVAAGLSLRQPDADKKRGAA